MKPIEKPFTQEELANMTNGVTAVISVGWRDTGDIETLNDTASELITGSECGLDDIEYKLVGFDYLTQQVYIEVNATISDNLDEQENDWFRFTTNTDEESCGIMDTETGYETAEGAINDAKLSLLKDNRATYAYVEVCDSSGETGHIATLHKVNGNVVVNKQQ